MQKKNFYSKNRKPSKKEVVKTINTKVSSEAIPRRTLENALPIAECIRDTYAGSATWEEIAKARGVSAKNTPNRYPLWAATAYGLIVKNDDNKYTVTELTRKIFAPNYEGEKNEGIVKALFTPSLLSKFYSDYNGKSLPSEQFFPNILENRYGIPADRTKEAQTIIIDNAKFANATREVDGKMVLSFSNDTPYAPTTTNIDVDIVDTESDVNITKTKNQDYSNICFIITPIGEEGSNERKHADTVLRHLISPILEEFNLVAVRADKIAKPGLINQQVIEHIAHSALCIADLSFNNPNAFYELGVRHAFKLPTIQIIRRIDKIPFDVAQGRTIIIDTADPYTIMDRFLSAKSELKEYVDASIKRKELVDDNPIGLFLPGLRVTIPK